jgi:hypothetical protein
MKAFEEKYTAWMDGRLAGKELEKFEKELADHGGLEAARTERTGYGRLQKALRKHGQTPELEFPNVFNQQVLDRMERESARDRVVPWRIRWLVWAGVGCLAVAAGLYQALIPKARPSGYWAEVKSVRVADPSLWAEPVYRPGEEVTLIWIDGLDYLPESYALR